MRLTPPGIASKLGGSEVNTLNKKLPAGIANAYWFQAFNAVSWQICLGSPLILFARELGASATTLGILAGLPPILTIMQIPASRYAADYGYKRLMLMGWSARVGVLVLLFLLPFSVGFLPRDAVVNLLLAVMFFFNLLRGLATCSWMPWITAIVPPDLRGFYLTRDRTFINIASVVALFISGFFMSRHTTMPGFALVFFIGFAGGALSLGYLKRIPDPPPPGPHTPADEVGWREMFRDIPFLRLLGFSAMVQLGLCAHATFALVFLREEVGLGDGSILWIGAAQNLLGMLALRLLGRHTDRVGSRPYLGLVLCWWLVAIPTWFLLAARAFEHPRAVVLGTMLASGFIGACYDIALTRLLMNTIAGKPGQARYFAVYAVMVSLIIGILPVFWGMGLDALRELHFPAWGVEWNRYTVFFAVETASLIPMILILLRLREPKAESSTFMVYQIFVGMPSRGLTQLMQMFR